MRYKLIFLLILSIYISPAQGAHAPKTFKVLTFNTWMLEILGKDRTQNMEERLTLMPKAIADTGADIVFLQEVWTEKARKGLINGLARHGYINKAHKNGDLL